MALIESWFAQDLKKPVRVQYLDGVVFTQDNAGNLVGVNVFDDGEAASISGTVSANVIRSDGGTVSIATGTISGNQVSVVLPQAAYAVPGVISIIIKITASSVVTTICCVVANVYKSTTDTVVDPGTIIPSIQTLISEIDTAVASIPADYSTLWTTLAPAYSTSATYAVGQYVTYNGGLYRCISAITTAESWTAAHWSAAKIGPDLSDVKSALQLEQTGNKTLASSLVESGTYNNSCQPTENTARLRTKKIECYNGETVVIKPGTNCNYFCYGTIDKNGSYSGASSWYNEEKKIALTNAVYFVVIFKNGSEGTTTLTASDYDAEITFGSLTASQITDAVDALNTTNKNIAFGGTKLTKDMFYQHDARNLVISKRIYVEAGNAISTKQSALYERWQIYDDDDNVLEEHKGTYDKVQIKTEVITFQHSGWFSIAIANGYNWGNSSAISINDMTADMVVINNMAESIAENLRDVVVPSIEEDTDNIYTKLIDEDKTSSSSEWVYYPCHFEYGQKYVIKVKFLSFTSTNNRKYSFRTTTAQYASSAYTVQVVATVDNTTPDLNKWYEYSFTAGKKSDGGTGNYLCFEFSVTDSSSCEIEVYSVTAQDALTRISKVEWINGTDIVSLNHDAKVTVLNGKKPFNRATTVPLALLHFSDIHASQTNLERIVDMANHLGTDIDDVICTGDMVSNNYSATCMDFWDAVDGAEDILMVVGNHDLADGEHGYSSDQIGQETAYAKYFSPYVSNWGVTMAGENLTYWYKDYSAKKVRLIGLNYLLTGDASTAQKTWLVSRLSEAKTAGYAVVIAEHSPLNSFTEIPCNFDIIGKSWGYTEILADIQSAVQDFIDGGGEFVCYIAGHSHCDYVGYNSNYPNQLCIVVTTALTTGADNDQRRVNGEKSQDAANVVLIDTVTKTVKLVRIGADMDTYLRGRHLFSIKYTDKTITAQS